MTDESPSSPGEQPPKRPRGRPRKYPLGVGPAPKRKRGRPRKVVPAPPVDLDAIRSAEFRTAALNEIREFRSNLALKLQELGAEIDGRLLALELELSKSGRESESGQAELYESMARRFLNHRQMETAGLESLSKLISKLEKDAGKLP